MAFAAEMAQYRASKREYEVWPGKNRFLCGGRVMLGPWSDCGPNTCIWCIIMGPLGAFFWFVGPRLLFKVPIMFFLVGILGLWTIIALLITGCSDPGIIPRQTRAEAWRQVLEARAFEKGKQVEESDAPQIMPSTLTMLVDGEMLSCRYCSTCNVFRPPRASHCSDCDNCCKEFDHHCPFVGNCVGERNYGSFCAFLICVVALIVSVLVSVLVVSSDVKAETTFNLVFITIICGYSLLMFFVIGGFSAFHCFLVVTGQTTKEKMKGLTAESKGRTVRCINRPKSLINPSRFLSDLRPTEGRSNRRECEDDLGFNRLESV